MADHHLPQGHNLFGTDQVLDGETVRDRFLTAFILQRGGFIESHRPPGMRPPPSSQDVLFLDLEAASLDAQDRWTVEREGEPLYVRFTEPWFPGDDDV